MKKISVICVLIPFLHGLSQQCTYFNTTNPFNDACGTTSYFTYIDAFGKDDFFFCLGAQLTSDNRQLAISKLDADGDTLWNRFYGASPKVYFAVRLFDFGTYMLVVSNVKDTSDSNAPFDACFTAFDYDGNFLWEERVEHPQNEQLRDVIRMPNGHLAAVGVSHSFAAFNGPGAGESYLLQVDSLGQVVSESTFGTGGREEGFGLAATTDGFVINAAARQVNGKDDVIVYRTDTLGVVQWLEQIGTLNLSENAGKICLLPDNTILATTAYPFGTTTTARLYKLDLNGQILWQQDYTNGTNLTVLDHFIFAEEDGTVFVGGGYQDSQGFELSEIVKIDPLGQTMFTRYYSPSNSINNYLLNIRKAEDGYILTGNATGADFIQRPWIIKTDRMLCDSSLCTSDNGSFEPYDCTNFPTDATFITGDGVLTHETGEEVSFENHSDYCTNREWFLGDGTVVYTDSLITHSYDDPGDYTVQLITHHGACKDTSELVIHINGQLGMNDEAAMRKAVRLYPNPSRGNFVLTFPYTTGISVRITDNGGRETARFSQVSASQQLSIHNLSPGSYHVQVFHKNTFVTTLRVTVIP